MVLSSLITAVVTIAGYLVLLGYRTDYAGHYIASYGAVLITAATLYRLFGKSGFITLLAALLLIAFGTYTESTLFRLAIFDPVDFNNQNLGACLAAAALWDGEPKTPTLIGLGVLGTVLVFAGFYVAFL